MQRKHVKIVDKNYVPVSWQLELFIAGGIIFSLYTSTDYFKHLFLLKYPISNFDYVQVALFFGTYILTRVMLIGFAINLILRTVWLAYSGINHWYPDDVNYDNLKLNFYQKKKHQEEVKASERLLTLDRWANLSFGLTIIFTFIVVSSLLLLVFVQFILGDVFGFYDLINSTIFNYTAAILALLLQLGVFDFILRKKHKRGAFYRIGEWLYTIYYYATGLFLYRRELLVMRTNGKTWVLLTFGSAYLLLALFISINQIGEFYPAGTFSLNIFDDRVTFDRRNDFVIDYHVYEDQLNENEVFFNGGIQSQYVTDNYLKLFIVHDRKYDWYLSHVHDSLKYDRDYNPPAVDSLRERYFEKRTELDQQSLNLLLEVELDHQSLTDLRWERYKHYKTQEEGYLTYIQVDTLQKGRHIINAFTRNRFTGTVKKSLNFGAPFYVNE
ncbi:MAG: hypothetical protein ACSHWW_06425 [Nonlabens sp.]|uniref:hypothetical protein n=1 Tax=Nonlabens sp. TaxID=1888209 RepID=UPI003EF6795C